MNQAESGGCPHCGAKHGCRHHIVSICDGDIYDDVGGEYYEEFKEALVEAFSKIIQSSSAEADHVWKNEVVQELWKEVSSCRADLEMPLDLTEVFEEMTLTNSLIELLPDTKQNREVHGDETLYTGITTDVDRRVAEHSSRGPKGATSFR